jgi:hypothetical protein
MDPAQIAAITELLVQLNTSKWWVIVAIIVASGGAAISFFYFLHLKQKERKETEIAKERRAKAYGCTLEELRMAILSQRDSTDRINKQHMEALHLLTATLGKLVTSVKSMTAKFDGTLPRNDSARFIHYMFENDLFRNICLVAERSLRENDYVNRRAYVRDRVRTAISEAMTEARNTLCSYPLSINANLYFETSPDYSGERFVLVDLLWGVLEPKFDHGAGLLEHRVEEAYLAIENCLHDYTTRIYSQLASQSQTKSTTRSDGATRFVTPLPQPPKSDSDSGLAALPSAPFETAGSATAALLRRQRTA